MTTGEVLRTLRTGLARTSDPTAEALPGGGQPSLLEALDYLSEAGIDWETDTELPLFHRYAVFVVTGNSEAHYVHIDVVLDSYDDKHQATLYHVALGKTFGGWETAWALAAACGELLGA